MSFFAVYLNILCMEIKILMMCFCTVIKKITDKFRMVRQKRSSLRTLMRTNQLTLPLGDCLGVVLRPRTQMMLSTPKSSITSSVSRAILLYCAASKVKKTKNLLQLHVCLTTLGINIFMVKFQTRFVYIDIFLIDYKFC